VLAGVSTSAFLSWFMDKHEDLEMSILDLFKEVPLSEPLKERLIRIDSQIIALSKAATELASKNSVLTREIKDLERENKSLERKLEQSEEQRQMLEKYVRDAQNRTSLGYVCPHCGSQNLARVKDKPAQDDRILFKCLKCRQESFFAQDIH